MAVVAFPAPFAWTRRWRQGLAVAAVGEGLQRGVDLAVALCDLLMIPVIEGHGLGQREEMLVPPIALQRARNGRLVVLAAGVSPLRACLSVALAGEDGTDDGQARHPRDIADDMR